MNKRIFGSATLFIILSLCLTLSSCAHADDTETVEPMQKLSWLIGKWTFEDNQVNGSYWERGTRDCIWVLDNKYIQCESKGTSNSGGKRSYYFILGYNRTDQRYEMVGLTSSFPRQNLYIVEPSADGKTLELQNHFWTAEGISPLSNATIHFNGEDKYVWEIRNGELDPETGKKAVGFIDTVQRVK